MSDGTGNPMVVNRTEMRRCHAPIVPEEVAIGSQEPHLLPQSVTETDDYSDSEMDDVPDNMLLLGQHWVMGGMVGYGRRWQ